MTIADHASTGGQARASKLTAEMRRASAQTAARARWDRQPEPVTPSRETPDRTTIADTEFDSEIDPHLGRL